MKTPESLANKYAAAEKRKGKSASQVLAELNKVLKWLSLDPNTIPVTGLKGMPVDQQVDAGMAIAEHMVGAGIGKAATKLALSKFAKQAKAPHIMKGMDVKYSMPEIDFSKVKGKGGKLNITQNPKALDTVSEGVDYSKLPLTPSPEKTPINWKFQSPHMQQALGQDPLFRQMPNSVATDSKTLNIAPLRAREFVRDQTMPVSKPQEIGMGDLLKSGGTEFRDMSGNRIVSPLPSQTGKKIGLEFAPQAAAGKHKMIPAQKSILENLENKAVGSTEGLPASGSYINDPAFWRAKPEILSPKRAAGSQTLAPTRTLASDPRFAKMYDGKAVFSPSNPSGSWGGPFGASNRSELLGDVLTLAPAQLAGAARSAYKAQPKKAALLAGLVGLGGGSAYLQNKQETAEQIKIEENQMHGKMKAWPEALTRQMLQEFQNSGGSDEIFNELFQKYNAIANRGVKK